MKKDLTAKLNELLASVAKEQHPAANKLRSKLASAIAILEEWPKPLPAAEAEKPTK